MSLEQKNNLLKDTGIPFLTDTPDLVNSLIRQPFYEFRDDFFVNTEWISIRLWNDYFIEEENFKILDKLMKLNDEDYFYACATGSKKEYFYNTIRNLSDILLARKKLDETYEYTSIWQFVSIKGNWAAISEYDGDSLFIGYNAYVHSKMEPFVQSNPNFDQFLSKP